MSEGLDEADLDALMSSPVVAATIEMNDPYLLYLAVRQRYPVGVAGRVVLQIVRATPGWAPEDSLSPQPSKLDDAYWSGSLGPEVKSAAEVVEGQALTSLQVDVLRLTGEGLSSGEIGRSVGIPRTRVAITLTQLMAIFGVKGRAALRVFADKINRSG